MKFTRYETKDLARAAAGTLTSLVLVAAFSSCALFGAPPDPLVGTWNVTVVSPLGTSEQSITVTEDTTGNGGLAGSIHVPDGDATIAVNNLLREGQTVTFDIVFDIQGQEVPAKFKGTIDGDNITGEFVTDFGNATVEGTRAVAE